MGLPSFLKRQYASGGYDFSGALYDGMMELKGSFIKCSRFPEQGKTSKAHAVSCVAKYGLKHKYYGARELFRYHENPYSGMTEIALFCRYEKNDDGTYTRYHKTMLVFNSMKEKVIAFTKERDKLAIQRIEKEIKIEQIRNAEGGRTYRGRMRQLILERDGYRCVLCGKSPVDGISLEVDHIIPWEDGGKTTYDNGRTVCSECNKGLHWNKKFNELKESATV